MTNFNINLSSKLYSDMLLIAVVLVVSLFIRVWKLDIYPPIIVDEPANIRDIDIILDEGLSLTGFHWDFSKSQIVHVPPVLLVKLGVDNKLSALRLSSVILSTFSLISFYFIVKHLTDRFLAFLTTMLFAASYYYLQFSRTGWTDVVLNIFLGLSVFALLIKIKSNPNYRILISFLVGVLLTIIFYSYRSGIIIIVTAFLIIIAETIKAQKKLAKHLINLTVIALTFLSLSFPWMTKILQNKEKYDLRLNVVSINNVNLPYNGIEDRGKLLYYQFLKTFSSWIILGRNQGLGTESRRYLPEGYSIVNNLVKIGFWIGLIAGLTQLKKTYYLYIIICMGMLGQIMTIDPPNGARGLIVLPCIYIFFALGIHKVYMVTNRSALLRAVFAISALLFVLFDTYFYFYWMSWINV